MHVIEHRLWKPRPTMPRPCPDGSAGSSRRSGRSAGPVLEAEHRRRGAPAVSRTRTRALSRSAGRQAAEPRLTPKRTKLGSPARLGGDSGHAATINALLSGRFSGATANVEAAHFCATSSTPAPAEPSIAGEHHLSQPPRSARSTGSGTRRATASICSPRCSARRAPATTASKGRSHGGPDSARPQRVNAGRSASGYGALRGESPASIIQIPRRGIPAARSSGRHRSNTPADHPAAPSHPPNEQESPKLRRYYEEAGSSARPADSQTNGPDEGEQLDFALGEYGTRRPALGAGRRVNVRSRACGCGLVS
jgi:hypothetical protein